MAEKMFKHFIIVRFFSFEDPKYPYDIYDPEFLSKQLVLAKNNALSSLNNQTKKDFELVFRVNEKFFSDPKYEFIFTELQNETTVPVKFIKNAEQTRLIKEATTEYDFVITSRMDFDDFIYKDAVSDIQNKISECEDILVYGYCSGYTYIWEELYPDYNLCDGIGHLAILQSVILKSSSAKKFHFISAYSFDHAKFKRKMKELLEKCGVEFSESMFQQNTSTIAYIYFRHEFSHYNLVNKSKMRIPNYPRKLSERRPLTTADITKEELAAEFGFHYDLKSIK